MSTLRNSKYWNVLVLLGVGGLLSGVSAAETKVQAKQWRAEKWSKSNPCTLQISKEEKHEIVVVKYRGSEKGERAVVSMELDNRNLAASGTVAIRAYNPSSLPVHCALAINTTGKYIYYESRTRAIHQGWNELKFKLSDAEYKSAASEWKHKAAIKDSADTRKLSLLVYNGPLSGHLMLASTTLPQGKGAVQTTPKKEGPVKKKIFTKNGPTSKRKRVEPNPKPAQKKK